MRRLAATADSLMARCVLTLADAYDVDLVLAFERTMDELDARLVSGA